MSGKIYLVDVFRHILNLSSFQRKLFLILFDSFIILSSLLTTNILIKGDLGLVNNIYSLR